VTTPTAPTSVKPERRWDIDWLRVIGILVVFAFHSGLCFTSWYPWHIRNAQESELIRWLIVAMQCWPMPLFMLLAGASTWFALRRRTPQQYVNERVARIFLPFVIGTFLLAPPQVYLERVHRGQFQGSYLQYLPHMFDGGAYPEGNISWEHLWFLLYLFIYAQAALPLFRFLRGDTGRRWISRLAAFCQHRGAVFLFALPLIIGQVALGWRFPQTRALFNDWTWHWVLFSVFVYGYVLLSDERFQRAIDREWKPALVLAVVSSVARVTLATWGSNFTIEHPLTWRYYILEGIAFRLGTWAWLVVLLGLARRYLSFSNRFLEYASPATYPVYMLHQTLVVIVQFYVVPWEGTIWPKYLVILLASLGLTMGVYEIVRRWSVTRALLGLRPRQKGSEAPALVGGAHAA